MSKYFAQLKTLGNLQVIDNQIDRLLEEKRQIPKTIERIKNQISTAQAALDEQKANLKTIQTQKLKKDKELEEAEKRISDDKTKLMNIKTNVEYAALLKEIGQIEKIADAKSEDLLLIMEQIEHAEAGIKKAQSQYEEARKGIEEETAKYDDRMVKIPQEIEALNAAKREYVSGLEPQLLQRYDGIRKARNGTAIVKANDRVCNGCNMLIPPQVINRLQRGEELIFCSSCARILYWDGEARINR